MSDLDVPRPSAGEVEDIDPVPPVAWWQEVPWRVRNEDYEHPSERYEARVTISLSKRMIQIIALTVGESPSLPTAIQMALGHAYDLHMRDQVIAGPSVLDLWDGEALPPGRAGWRHEYEEMGDGDTEAVELTLSYTMVCYIARAQPETTTIQQAIRTLINDACEYRAADHRQLAAPDRTSKVGRGR